jgi:hypothetical protein
MKDIYSHFTLEVSKEIVRKIPGCEKFKNDVTIKVGYQYLSPRSRHDVDLGAEYRLSSYVTVEEEQLELWEVCDKDEDTKIEDTVLTALKSYSCDDIEGWDEDTLELKIASDGKFIIA